MQARDQERLHNGDHPSDPFWLRVLAAGWASLFIGYVAWTWISNLETPLFTDHLSFWAAGRLALEGRPAAAYDIAAHAATIGQVMPTKGILAFPYPPPFLAVVAPFSIAPYAYSFAAWALVTGAVYALVCRKLVPLPYAFSHPAAFVNGFFSQSGFLVVAVFLAGVRFLDRKPIFAGAILGLLIIKPHYALLLPVAVIAARAWLAILGAGITAVSLLLASLVLFGPSTFDGYFGITANYLQMFAEGRWHWPKLISPFALVLYFGLSPILAVFIQLSLATAAIVVTWLAWANEWDEKVPILATGTLLLSPYLLIYDALLLVSPLGYWVTKRPRPHLVLLVWVLCLPPVLTILRLYNGPNTIALASIVSLCALTANRLPKDSLRTISIRRMKPRAAR